MEATVRAMEPDAAPDPLWSRRRFLKVAGLTGITAVAAVIADELLAGSGGSAAPSAATAPEARLASTPPAGTPLGASPSPGDGRLHYRSRPDLTPPAIDITRDGGRLAPGLIFFTPDNGTPPDGLMIADSQGEPVWIHPELLRSAVNLRATTYRGEPVLTWWEGKISSGLGAGEFVIADTTYREITRVRAGNGYQGDLHEFIISPEDTALFLITNPVAAPVPQSSGAAPGQVIEGIVQELDIASGRVLLEWHSLPIIDPSESYLPAPTDGSAYDYLHANSIDIDRDGDLIVSGRHTWAVYGLDRASGDLRWRLGGKRSDYQLGPGAEFAWQHDARAYPDGTISIFDDGAMGPPPQFETSSRGIILQPDRASMSVRLQRAFVHPEGIVATSQGSFQLLPNGNAFIGWGKVPRFSEFDAAGQLLFDGAFPAGKQSYRAMRYPWTARPAEKPVVAGARVGASSILVYASWNGATDVATWQVLGGGSSAAMHSLGHGVPDGFETVIRVESDALYVAVRGLDRHGRELGRSAAVAVNG
jgi:Arylsulfotransferase (ASST)